MGGASEHSEAGSSAFKVCWVDGKTIKVQYCPYEGRVPWASNKQGPNSATIRKRKKIIEAEAPKTKKAVRSFLGLTGFYRDFIPEYAAKAAPLTDLLKKGKSENVIWEEPQEKAFFTLKNSVIAEPILCLPDLSRKFILRTDASDVGLGAALC